jgi:hypothetical protein
MNTQRLTGLLIIALSFFTIWFYGGIVFSLLSPSDGIFANCFTPPLYVCLINLGLGVLGAFTGVFSFRSKISNKMAINITMLLCILGAALEIFGW